MKERTNYLILVLCEDVAIEDLDEEMRIYLRTNTYLKRDSRWFWDKLRYAMPQKTLLELQEGLNVRQDDDWCGVHAIARAQHAELVQNAADEGDNGLQNGYGQLMQDDAAGDLGQIIDDMPLVEIA